jgi:hypothetical protein
MVEEFEEEGLLLPRDADVLLLETHNDYMLLEREWLRKLLWNDIDSGINNVPTISRSIGNIENTND